MPANNNPSNGTYILLGVLIAVFALVVLPIGGCLILGGLFTAKVVAPAVDKASQEIDKAVAKQKERTNSSQPASIKDALENSAPLKDRSKIDEYDALFPKGLEHLLIPYFNESDIGKKYVGLVVSGHTNRPPEKPFLRIVCTDGSGVFFLKAKQLNMFSTINMVYEDVGKVFDISTNTDGVVTYKPSKISKEQFLKEFRETKKSDEEPPAEPKKEEPAPAVKTENPPQATETAAAPSSPPKAQEPQEVAAPIPVSGDLSETERELAEKLLRVKLQDSDTPLNKEDFAFAAGVWDDADGQRFLRERYKWQAHLNNLSSGKKDELQAASAAMQKSGASMVAADMVIYANEIGRPLSTEWYHVQRRGDYISTQRNGVWEVWNGHKKTMLDTRPNAQWSSKLQPPGDSWKQVDSRLGRVQWICSKTIRVHLSAETAVYNCRIIAVQDDEKIYRIDASRYGTNAADGSRVLSFILRDMKGWVWYTICILDTSQPAFIAIRESKN